MMQFPKVAAAQKLQTLLLLTTLAAILLAGLLFSDLFRNLSSTVVADARKSLTSAVRELLEEARFVAPENVRPDSLADLDLRLQRISYETLRSYPDVEGGYLVGSTVVGHTFPTYTEPGSELRQPPIERDAVLEALRESRVTGKVAHRIFDDAHDLVVVSVLAGQQGNFSAWGLKRYIGFSDSRQFGRTLFLAGLLLLAMVSVAFALSLSYRLQRGFAAIQAGLNQLRTEPGYRLSQQQHDLKPIVYAINEMAESRERLELALRREDRLRVMGRVVAGIAHEIRNPLNSMRLAVQVMARRLRGNPAANESIEPVLAEVDRLDNLLRSLLVFRADESRRVRRQQVRPVVERTLALVMPQIRERNIKVAFPGEMDFEAKIDGDHLQQALMNLLLNAIDAAGEGGTIRITLTGRKDQAEIEVADSGPGLTADQQEHLFEAFYTTKKTGTGLGLAVSKTLLENMGASIEYVPGRSGARFRIMLPAEAVHGVPA